MKTIWASLDKNGLWTIETEGKEIILNEEEFRKLQAIQDKTIWVCFVPPEKMNDEKEKAKILNNR